MDPAKVSARRALLQRLANQSRASPLQVAYEEIWRACSEEAGGEPFLDHFSLAISLVQLEYFAETG